MNKYPNIAYPIFTVTLAIVMGMSLTACTTTNNVNSKKPAASKPVVKKSPRLNKSAKVPLSKKLKRDKDRVLLYAEIDSNHHSASNVNLVFVHDPKLTNMISRLSSQEWFTQRRKLLSKHADSLSVISSQVHPGEKQHLKRFTKRQKQAAMIVVFSSYRSEGEHKVIIKPSDINYVYFMKNHFIAK